MDSIKIVIIRNVNTDGTGGTVVDTAHALLDSLPDGTALLDAVIAACGQNGIPDGVTPERNVALNVREFLKGLVLAQQENAVIEQAKQQLAAAADNAVTIVE